jgi:hypothetical protein
MLLMLLVAALISRTGVASSLTTATYTRRVLGKSCWKLLAELMLGCYCCDRDHRRGTDCHHTQKHATPTNAEPKEGNEAKRERRCDEAPGWQMKATT